MSYLTLDNIVRGVIARKGESNLRRYQQYLQMAIDGYKFLNLQGGSTNSVKTKQLTMLANKAVNLPTDYVKYLKIGICVRGRVVVLGLDESMCLNDAFSECGDPLETAIESVDSNNYPAFLYGFPFLGYYHNNQFVESMFGMGGGFNSRGYYKINHEKNQIQFSSSVPNVDIVLEYVSDGINPDGTTTIPVVANEYLLSWVYWKIAEHDPKGTASERDYWRTETMVHFRNCKHFAHSFSHDEYLDSYRKNVYATPKR